MNWRSPLAISLANSLEDAIAVVRRLSEYLAADEMQLLLTQAQRAGIRGGGQGNKSERPSNALWASEGEE